MTPPITLAPEHWDALANSCDQPYGYPSHRWPQALGGATKEQCQELAALVRAADRRQPLQVPEALADLLLHLVTAVRQEVGCDIPCVVSYGDRDPYEVVRELEERIVTTLAPHQQEKPR